MHKRSQTIQPENNENEMKFSISPRKKVRSHSASNNFKNSKTLLSPPDSTADTDRYPTAKAIFSEREDNLTRFMSAQLTERSKIHQRDNGFSWYSSNSETSRYSEGPVHVEIPDNESHSGRFETATVKALDYCRKTVLRPYLITLCLVGWKRLFSQSVKQNLLQKVINILYPILIISILIMLYIVSVYACKNGAGGNSPEYIQFNNNTNITRPFHCQHMLSLFFIPYFLHLLAYLYALYSFRFNSSENIDSLMEMAFVLAARCQNVLVLNKNILYSLLLIMILCITWQLLVCIEQVIYIVLYVLCEVDQASSIDIVTLVLNITGAVVLKVATGLVFIILILHYTTQCTLIISLARGIKQGLQEKSTSLSFAMRDMYMCKTYLGRLNREAANSVSLCLISIIIYLFIDVVEAVRLFRGFEQIEHPLQVVYLVFDCVLWITALSVPLLMAARVQTEFTKLKNMTFGVYLFRYKDSTNEQINQFFFYANSITYKVRLFNVTVRSSFISLFFLATFFAIIIFLVTNSKI